MAERGRLLIGAFEDAEHAGRFASRVAFIPQERILEQWPQARAAFLGTPRGTVPPATSLEPATVRELTERLESAPLLCSSLKGHQWRISNVPLADLVTAQPHVNLSRVEMMMDRIKEGLVPLMFPTDTAVQVKTEAADGPTISFISDRRELTFTAARVQRLEGSGAIEVVMRIEPRPNYVSVVDSRGRLFVRNGNHRLVAAWRAGLREVACVVIEGDVSKLFEERWNKLSVAALLFERSPRLSDLADCASGCIEVDLRPRRFVTRVRAEQLSNYGD